MTDTATQGDQRQHVVAPVDEGWGGKWLMAMLVGAVAIIAALFFGVIALAVILSDSSESPASASTLDVTLSEFRIGGQLTAPAGDVNLQLTNTGSVEHNIVAPDLGVRSSEVGPGGTVDFALGSLPPGEYELFCDISGHEASGMVSTLVVTGEGAPAMAAGGHGGEDTDYAALDIAMTESILAFPAETEGKGNPILEPTEVEADGTKVFDLTAEIIEWEVEPGRIVEAWTYNGVVPAPQLLLDRGDKIKVRVVNDLPMGTDIHWHGVHTPNDQDGVAPLTQDLIEPNGGTFEYSFTVEDDAIGMYHAHNHAQMQVVNGMFGVIRIGENPIPRGVRVSGVNLPEDLELAVDMPMVLNDAGTIGYSLNGKSFPATEPLGLNQGDWVSVHYYNEGLQIHPMHLHQFPQLIYAKDGIALDEPYWADTVNVAPGERFSVLFRADDPGAWVWHCHILNHVEREDGMFGMVTALVVSEDNTFDPELVPVNPTNFLLMPHSDATNTGDEIEGDAPAGEAADEEPADEEAAAAAQN